MPRKSAAAAIAVDVARTRLQPAPSLKGAVRRHFVATVNAVETAHFRESDRPLLENYARVLTMCDHAARALDDEGSVVEGRVSPWIRVLGTQQRLAAMLARSLRLTPQSRMDRKTAGKDTGGRGALAHLFGDDE